MEFYNKVTHRQYSGGKAPANMAVFMEQERKLREERAKQASELKKTTEANDRIMRRFASNDQAKRILLEAQKKQVIAELYNYIPLCIMNEVFSRIMLKALPHDEDYIQENSQAIKAVNQVYLHHLGGLKYLKEQAARTNSSFLKKFYEMVKEDSAEVIKDKLEDIRDAKSENDIKDILDNKVTPAQDEKIKKDIDDLNPDEAAELVQNKVLDVVRDEAKRQAEDANFRAELKDKADAYDQQHKEEQEPSPAEGDVNKEEVPPEESPAAADNTEEPADENPESEESPEAEEKPEEAPKDTPAEPTTAPTEDKVEEPKENPEPPKVEKDEQPKSEEKKPEPAKPAEKPAEDKKEEPKKDEAKTEAAMLAKYMLNASTILHENTLFFSMMRSIHKDMINVLKEGAYDSCPKTVLTSPLNLNAFDVYLKDYQRDFRQVDALRISNKAPLAGTDVHINSEDIMAEALTQYTLLETAMTLKLINPKPSEVHAVANYNLSR